MLAIPAPIVVALLLLTVVMMSRERLMSMPSGRLFMGLLLMYALGLTLLGIRWTWNITAVLPLHFILSTAWCSLAWLAFRSLSRDGPVFVWQHDWPHLIPSLAVLLAPIIQRNLVDVVVVCTDLIYAALLARLAQRGPDALRMVKLDAARACHLALWVTSGLLCFFAVIEVTIVLNFILAEGRHAALIVGFANIPSILLLGLAALSAGQSRSQENLQSETKAQISNNISSQSSPLATATDSKAIQPCKADSPVLNVRGDRPASVSQSAEDEIAATLLQKLRILLVDQALYAEPELNLQRLARKAGVPARQVSRAINSQTGQNVSQWVNTARIEAACERLRVSDDNITTVMLSVGFVTKSNFNREFRRITGHSPSEWRENSDDRIQMMTEGSKRAVVVKGHPL